MPKQASEITARMLAPALALAVLASQTAATGSAADAPGESRTVTVALTDERGAAVEGLDPGDVAVLVNGTAREVTRVTRDERPLTLALLVDTSQAIASSFRLQVLPAMTTFLRALPEGSRYSLWTTGDRPTKILDASTDPAEAGPALRRVIVTGGNTMLDALVEAAEDLRELEGERNAVVAVTGIGVEFSNRERHQVVEQARRTGAVFLSVQYDEGEVSIEDRRNYEYVLSMLARDTGGLYEATLSAMGVPSSLQKLSADLRSHYRVTYAALPGAEDPKLEVTVARPGTKARVVGAGTGGSGRR